MAVPLAHDEHLGHPMGHVGRLMGVLWAGQHGFPIMYRRYPTAVRTTGQMLLRDGKPHTLQFKLLMVRQRITAVTFIFTRQGVVAASEPVFEKAFPR